MAPPSPSDTEEIKPKRGRPKDPPEDDEAEWRMILAAFQMYKAAYGDLKVPSRFVVPAMAPWPCELICSCVFCDCDVEMVDFESILRVF